MPLQKSESIEFTFLGSGFASLPPRFEVDESVAVGK